MPVGATLPQPLSCAAERCALGNCRRGGGCGGGRADGERRLDDLVAAAAAETPGADELTAAILARLESAGLLPGEREDGAADTDPAGLDRPGERRNADHHLPEAGPRTAGNVRRPPPVRSLSMPVACAPSAVAVCPDASSSRGRRDGRS